MPLTQMVLYPCLCKHGHLHQGVPTGVCCDDWKEEIRLQEGPESNKIHFVFHINEVSDNGL